ncbi:rubrerythrin-like domain-containing protein [Candidatus Halobonum tyrrellensis]|uniref:DUF7129 domain-containing protein n=1 Tax=Candidatus Halobonum tyrrellensis G22 TaxID=1324957 RepID=V4HKU7_9EURY|nr:rubrerythrin-like domain-containing protein [Candidatus Halobonum tyrrellensis]ESP88549.1 hypothetical protein K933_08817 [Candidatus Halobonum tyrrellensis G22]
MPAIQIDPYETTDGLFECVDCGHRETAATHPGACPECDGEVRNIAISRE